VVVWLGSLFRICFHEVAGLVCVYWIVFGVVCLCCIQLFVVLWLCVTVVICERIRVEAFLGRPHPFGGSLLCFLVCFVCVCFALFVF